MPESAGFDVPRDPAVRFAPSPTGFLHVGSARTFIFNWLYARQSGGTMILRLDDTDVERNTQASVDSIFDGLKWLNLSLGRGIQAIRAAGTAPQDRLGDFRERPGLPRLHARAYWRGEKSGAQGTWLFNPGARELSRAESDRRAAAGEPFALAFSRAARGRASGAIY